jgi:hypothetical protein
MTAAAVMNLGMILNRTARLWPNAVGLIKGQQQWTWGELESSANALAHALLEFGIATGERILVQCPNDRYMYESHYAITRAGVCNGMSTMSSSPARAAASWATAAFTVTVRTTARNSRASGSRRWGTCPCSDRDCPLGSCMALIYQWTSVCLQYHGAMLPEHTPGSPRQPKPPWALAGLSNSCAGHYSG